MDDFRVGPVTSADPYGHRQPSGAIARRREKQHDDEAGRQQEDTADIFEPVEAADTPQDAAEAPQDAADEAIEDYYLPSDPNGDAP
jgi:hypothetical protein